MLRHIVIPLDGSEFAARALPVGVELAAAADASVHVIGLARSGAEFSWTYDHVHDDAKRAGIDAEDVDVRIDPEPVRVLLNFADLDDAALCFASHDRMPVTANLMHSVGSALIERVRRPMVVVGRNVSTETMGADVVVALDGVDDPEPLLAVATEWALALHARLRIVTVFEPVPADIGRPEHFTRRLGPAGDPDVYLAAMQERVADLGLAGVDTSAIPDPVGVSAGLAHHLEDAPARLLVVGGGRRGASPVRGVVRNVLDTVPVPLLIVNRSVM